MYGLLDKVSYWFGGVRGNIDFFKLERIDKRLEAVCHLPRRVWIDDENRPHLPISGAVSVAIFTHGADCQLGATLAGAICPAVKLT